MKSHSLKISITALVICFFTTFAAAQTFPEWDVDGDGVTNADDICPYTYGPASNKGCPDSTKLTSVWTNKEMVDTARTVYLRKWKNAYGSMQRQNALDEFADEVDRIARGDSAIYAYAINPVVKSLAVDRADDSFAELIALTFNRRTRFSYDDVMALLPAAIRQRLEKLQAEDMKAVADAERIKAEKEATEKGKRLAKQKEAAGKVLTGKGRCDSVIATITLRGMGMGRGATYNGESGIWVGFDCATDMVIFRAEGNYKSWGVKLRKIKAGDFAYSGIFDMMYKQNICSLCEGAGCQVYNDEKLYPVEMPGYYKPGYKVTKIYKGNSTKASVCQRCKGTGVRK